MANAFLKSVVTIDVFTEHFKPSGTILRPYWKWNKRTIKIAESFKKWQNFTKLDSEVCSFNCCQPSFLLNERDTSGWIQACSLLANTVILSMCEKKDDVNDKAAGGRKRKTTHRVLQYMVRRNSFTTWLICL